MLWADPKRFAFNRERTSQLNPRQPATRSPRQLRPPAARGARRSARRARASRTSSHDEPWRRGSEVWPASRRSANTQPSKAPPGLPLPCVALGADVEAERSALRLLANADASRPSGRPRDASVGAWSSRQAPVGPRTRRSRVRMSWPGWLPSPGAVPTRLWQRFRGPTQRRTPRVPGRPKRAQGHPRGWRSLPQGRTRQPPTLTKFVGATGAGVVFHLLNVNAPVSRPAFSSLIGSGSPVVLTNNWPR